jgi:long-chain acyl-CoA synthetase
MTDAVVETTTPRRTRRPEAAGSVAQLLRSRLTHDAEVSAVLRKVNGTWTRLTWAELCAEVEKVAWGVVALGVEPGARVAVIGATRLEWTLCDLGIAQAGGIVVPIYQSSTAEELRFILDDCGAVAIFAENLGQLEKLRQVRAKLPALSRVVLMDGDGGGDPWVMSLDELRAKGRERCAAGTAELDRRLAAQQPEDLAMIIYTSGTTGVPKGVMITNDAVLMAAEATQNSGMFRPGDSIMTFLPYAHVAAQLGKYASLGTGATSIYAESLEKLVDNAGETGPSILGSVPRVFEKAYNAVVTSGLSQPGLKGRLFRMAMRELDHYAAARDQGRQHSSVAFTIARRLVFPKVAERFEQRFGGKLRVMISGGAPLPRKIGYFFELIGHEVLELYGLTESNAITTTNFPGRNRVGTVGEAWPGVELRIAPDGEILQRGRSVMRGYYNRPELTREAIDADGWFHTGDIGELDSTGYLRITDRKKDLIKTSGGKYVVPQMIEGSIKTASEVISQVVVIGDQRKFVSVLVTVVDEQARKIAAAAGEPAGTAAEAARSKAVRARVQAAIDEVNARLPSFSTVKRLTILERDFSQETGELTPSLKVKRKACTDKYRAEIERMYQDA